MRAEWAGIAINLKTMRPTKGQLKDAVEQMLRDHSFKQRAVELAGLTEDWNRMDKVRVTIEELAESVQGNKM